MAAAAVPSPVEVPLDDSEDEEEVCARGRSRMGLVLDSSSRLVGAPVFSRDERWTNRKAIATQAEEGRESVSTSKLHHQGINKITATR